MSHWPLNRDFTEQIDLTDFLIDHRQSLRFALERQQWEEEDTEFEAETRRRVAYESYVEPDN